jgi:hypothetical protein
MNLIRSLVRYRAPATGIILGALYGLLLRVGFEAGHINDFLEIMSVSFLFVAPFAVGAIAVFFAMSDNRSLPIRKQVGVAAFTMLFFLVSMFTLFLEGFVCIALLAPVFFLGAILGGLLMGLIIKYARRPRSALCTIALLPLIFGPIEAHEPIDASQRRVTTSIVIAAPPEVVFSQLTTVREIRPDELGTAFVYWIGLPKPVEASMHGEGIGAVRTSRWEKGVSFKEKITEWNPPTRLHYVFDIPPHSIPRDALDRHVELGGRYFTVLDGGYDIERLADGSTKLELSTAYLNKSHLTAYGNLWANLVLNDFHRSILVLMKHRSEAAKAPVTASR